MYKIPVIHKEDYTVYLEPARDCKMIHCDVHNWTPSIAKQLKKDFDTLRSLHPGGYFIARHEKKQGDLHLKFLKLMGFEFYKHTPDFDYWLIGGK